MTLFIISFVLLSFASVKSGYGQLVRSLEASNELPSYLKGFEADRPMVVVEQNRDEEYISISRIFYRPQNDEIIQITFKDYSVNPKSYQKQLSRLKKLKKEDNNTSVSRYKGNLMNRERRENYIEKGLYLGQNKAVEIVHEGAISDTTLSTILLNRLDLELVKAKL